jgi:hypothetical protein
MGVLESDQSDRIRARDIELAGSCSNNGVQGRNQSREVGDSACSLDSRETGREQSARLVSVRFSRKVG